MKTTWKILLLTAALATGGCATLKPPAPAAPPAARATALAKPCLAAVPAEAKLEVLAPPRTFTVKNPETGGDLSVTMMMFTTESANAFGAYLEELGKIAHRAAEECVERAPANNLK